jgi:hypothetical protein
LSFSDKVWVVPGFGQEFLTIYFTGSFFHKLIAENSRSHMCLKNTAGGVNGYPPKGVIFAGFDPQNDAQNSG